MVKDESNRRVHAGRAPWLAAAFAAAAAVGADDVTRPTQQERMAALGYVRHRGAWRTAQEIDLLERAERTTLAQKEWNARLARLRRRIDQPSQAEAAVEELREVADPAAVPALAAAVAKEPVSRVRGWYVEALSHVRAPEAVGVLAGVAVDHADPETRIAAVERLVVIGPRPAMPVLVAALGSGDNARVNRAAEALGRLGATDAIGPLIEALETRHVVLAGDGTPEGSTSATFTPGGGGLSLGGGAKRSTATVRNERVLEALVSLTGTDLGWDAPAWRAWLAARNAPPPGFDPRRG